MTKRGLVIDDDAAVRKAFELALRGTDYVVELADSGQAGIDSAAGTAPDLVYLDLRMPGMSGVEVLRELRGQGHSCPIIIVTAFHREFFDQLVEVRKDEIDFELLQKPLERDQIIKVTQAVLSQDVIVD